MKIYLISLMMLALGLGATACQKEGADEAIQASQEVEQGPDTTLENPAVVTQVPDAGAEAPLTAEVAEVPAPAQRVFQPTVPVIERHFVPAQAVYPNPPVNTAPEDDAKE